MSTTENLVARGKQLAAGAGALATAVALGATLLAVPAQAAPGPAKPYGVVTAKTGLNQRQYPSTDSSVRGPSATARRSAWCARSAPRAWPATPSGT